MSKKIRIFMEDVVLVNNKAYFFSRYWNALYAANLKERKTEFISTMPEENWDAMRLCAGIIYHKGKLILVPMTAKKIWIYDLKRNIWKGLERRYIKNEDSHRMMFRAIKYKSNLFFIGSNYPAIIRMNLDNYKLEYWEEPYEFLKTIKNGTECYFRADHVLIGNRLYLASCLNNFVLCLDLEALNFTWFEVGESGFQYSGIAWDDEYYWLSPRMGTPIVKWDGKNHTEYFSLPDEFACDKYNFLGVQYDDGKLVFPGMLQNRTIVINSKYPHDMEIREGHYTFYRCSYAGKRLMQTVDGCFQWRYSRKSQPEQMYCEIPAVNLREYFRSQFGKIRYDDFKNGILKEFCSILPFYLLKIEREVKIRNKKTQIGELIWRITQN